MVFSGFVFGGVWEGHVMSRLSIFTVVGAAASVFAAAAHAADAPEPYFPSAQPIVVQEFASGWYIRGDIGYRLNSFDGASTFFSDPITGSSINDTAVFGIGGGYKAGWFRADLTIDYSGRATYKADVAGLPAGNQPGLSTKIEMVTTLANVYADLGTWWGFTPYVGAGAGAAYMRSVEFYDYNSLVMPQEKQGTWNFAWAAIAGMSYRIGANLLADASYRYLSLGDAVTAVNAAGNQLTVKDITAHEFRVGLRYNLD
jgi:opacity protein-like surface antigen